MHLTKNYNTDGGDRMVIGGVLEFEQGAEVKNFPGGGSGGGSDRGGGPPLPAPGPVHPDPGRRQGGSAPGHPGRRGPAPRPHAAGRRGHVRGTGFSV